LANIENDVMTLNQAGEVVKKTWLEIPVHFPDASLSAFVIMPNHFHGIIIINDNTV
jgi:putative transposase